MKHKWVITIGREYCSGGGATGLAVSEALGISYYDKNLVDEAADLARIDVNTAWKHDEKPVNFVSMASFMSLFNESYYPDDPDLMMPMGMKVAAAQSMAIEQIAKREPCVIVGRCADFVLRDRDYVFNVFLRADLEKRVERVMEQHRLNAADARKLIRQTDKTRASYYKGHTQQVWGDPGNYHLVLDVGKFGIDGSAKIIVDSLRMLDER